MNTLNDGIETVIWKKYGKQLLLGTFAVLLVFSAVQLYLYYQAKQAYKASALYDQMVMSIQANKLDQAVAQGSDIIKNYRNTAYAPMSSLMLAKLAVEKNDFESAVKHLQFAIRSDQKGPIKQMATVRLARILSEQKKVDEAFALLDLKNVPEVYISLYEEMRGDLYLLKNEVDKARASYQAAIKALPEGVPPNRLQLKQNELGVKENS